jgi:hypothetical protein
LKNEELKRSLYRAENSIIARIFTFPKTSTNGIGGLELFNEIKTHIPKAIIRNKYIFEAIFSQL